MRLAQLDRAFGFGPKGRGFESSNARYVERLETLKNQWFPAYFVLVRGTTTEKIIELTTRNAERLFDTGYGDV